jgi:lysine 2,3-aminomutase
VYCRFCFRRASIGPGCPGLTAVQFQACIDYIQAHPEIWEVIFTGGDPLILPLKTLGTWMTQVLSIPQVQILRIHTRVPSVLPHKINTALLDILAAAEKPIYMAIHMNHPDEFTPEVEQALRQLHHVGVVLVSQTVLLKGVNDNIETLSTLMRCFIKNRVKPYYLHQGDLAPGTAHFRTRISEGRALMKALRGRFSGLCQPCYVLDIPGGYGKSPLTAEYIHGSEIEDYQGQRHKILQDL